MKFGILNIPYASEYVAGRQSAGEVIARDLEVTRWADQYGLHEAFFAEHYTLGMEPSPAPDVMIAAASQITQNIKLGAGAHLLPYHNPVALAHRMLWLDHMTGGRYIAGVAPGAYPSDAQLFGTGKANPKMMAEALDIIEAIWYRQGPFVIEGEYFKVDMPPFDEAIHGPHLRSRQARIPMVMTGMQATSPTLTEAGRRGYEPMSQAVHADVLVKHWETYESAATAAGHAADRSTWRVTRFVFVADTDEQARQVVRNGDVGELWRNANLPSFARLGLTPLLTGGEIDADDLTVDWLIENLFFVGSPETVAEKIRALHERTGGFGGVQSSTYDYGDHKDLWERSFQLLGEKVVPLLADLTGESSAS